MKPYRGFVIDSDGHLKGVPDINPKIKFVIFPKFCKKSGKFLWLVRAYRVPILRCAKHDWIYKDIVGYDWYSQKEYTWMKLKGDI